MPPDSSPPITICLSKHQVANIFEANAAFQQRASMLGSKTKFRDVEDTSTSPASIGAAIAVAIGVFVDVRRIEAVAQSATHIFPGLVQSTLTLCCHLNAGLRTMICRLPTRLRSGPPLYCCFQKLRDRGPFQILAERPDRGMLHVLDTQVEPVGRDPAGIRILQIDVSTGRCRVRLTQLAASAIVGGSVPA